MVITEITVAIPYLGASIVVSAEFVLLIWASLSEPHSDVESAIVQVDSCMKNHGKTRL